MLNPQSQSWGRAKSSAPAAVGAPRLWRILVLGTLVVALLLGLLGLLTQRSFARLSAANDWSLHTYQVLSKIDGVSQILDAHEAQLRGFALSGDPHYLAQLQSTRGQGARGLRDVKVLTSDRLLQQQRLTVIEPDLLDYNRRYLEPFMAQTGVSAAQLEGARQLAAAQMPARSLRAAQLQRSLREMEMTERGLLSVRAAELQMAQDAAGRTFTGVGTLTLLLAGALLAMLARSFGAQNRAARQLGALNASLRAEVAERRVAEESLRASEAGFRHLAEDSLDLICRHAPDGTLTYVSPAARPLLGYSSVEMTGVHFWRFLAEAKTAPGAITTPDGTIASEGEPAPGATSASNGKAALDATTAPGATTAPNGKATFNGKTVPSAREFGASLDKTRGKPLLQCFRSARGQKVWLETVGHAIVDPDSGEVRAWHTTSRDVSARVHDERERARLLDGLRAVVEIADELIAAPTEETLLQRAVELARARLGLGRCSIYLADASGDGVMRGTWGTNENGEAIRENELRHDTKTDLDPDDDLPGIGERWIVRHHQKRFVWRDGKRVELPGTGWIARTLIATRSEVIGLFFHDGVPGDDPHDAVAQELVAVYCSLLGALLESARARAGMTAQQKLMETIVRNAPVFLYSVDLKERFTVATGTVLARIDFDKDAMIGRTVGELMGANSLSARSIRRALAGESFEMEMPYADRFLKMWRQPLYDESGYISGMIGLGMDVTAQHQTALELRASETRYRQVADSLQEVLFQTDAAGNWSFLNPAWTEITGYDVDQSLGQDAAATLHPDDRAAFEKLLDQARSPAFDAQVPLQILRFVRRGAKDAEVAGAENVGAEVAGAEVAGAEVAGAEVAGAEVAGAGLPPSSNRGASARSEALGIDRDDESAVSSSVYRADWKRAAAPPPSPNALAGANQNSFHFGEIERDDAIRWIEIALRPNFDGDGNFTGTAGTLSDVSQRVRAENALRATLEMQRAILQSATYAIVSTDPNGTIQSFNPAAETLFGVSATQVVGRATPAIFHDGDELRARALELGLPDSSADFQITVARARQRGGSDEREWSCLRADGARFPMRISHAVLRGPDGEIAGYVSIGYDLSETRRAQQIKDEFVSVVSHELRTPLTSIRGALGLLSGGVAGTLPPSAGQMLQIAEKNADRLMLLINDILDIEKIASGKMRFEMREISLSELVKSALESNRGYAETLGVSIELEPLEAPVRGAIVRGDEGRLQQVLGNLLSNACKWTPQGSAVKLSARAHGGGVRISVRDAGPGVPPEFVPRLFERFTQADGSATRGQGGTGLGLTIAQAIVREHGGELHYLAPDPPNGRAGATFYFDLKAELPAPRAVTPARGRMLVVEDDAEVAEVLRAILEDAGYAVALAPSRAAALTRARGGERFSGATLDLHLPDGNGLELLEELRALPQTRDLPVVIVSSFCEDAREGEHGVQDWLSKPVEPGQLLRAVADLDGGKARILHVEDDPDIRQVTALILGETAQVSFAATLAQGRAQLKSEPFDLVILDIGLPDGSGLELLETVEFLEQSVPVVIFSAREEEAEAATKVAAALIKSRTSNEALRAKVEELLQERAQAGV